MKKIVSGIVLILMLTLGTGIVGAQSRCPYQGNVNSQSSPSCFSNNCSNPQTCNVDLSNCFNNGTCSTSNCTSDQVLNMISNCPTDTNCNVVSCPTQQQCNTGVDCNNTDCIDSNSCNVTTINSNQINSIQEALTNALNANTSEKEEVKPVVQMSNKEKVKEQPKEEVTVDRKKSKDEVKEEITVDRKKVKEEPAVVKEDNTRKKAKEEVVSNVSDDQDVKAQIQAKKDELRKIFVEKLKELCDIQENACSLSAYNA